MSLSILYILVNIKFRIFLSLIGILYKHHKSRFPHITQLCKIKFTHVGRQKLINTKFHRPTPTKHGDMLIESTRRDIPHDDVYVFRVSCSPDWKTRNRGAASYENSNCGVGVSVRVCVCVFVDVT